MSLVANYTDSEDEAEPGGDTEGGRETEEINHVQNNQDHDQGTQINSSISPPETGPSSSTRLRNPFGVDDNDDNSSESSDDDKPQMSTAGEKVVGDGTLLENPFRFFGSAQVAAEDSVFRVEFREQDAKKTAVLEKHVKMSHITPAATMINGKKICWNNRRGRCRFGHNCKFAHDTDTAVIDPDSVVIKLPDKNFDPVQLTIEQIAAQGQQKRNPFCMDKINWDSETPVALSSLAQLSGSDAYQQQGALKKRELKDDDDEESCNKLKKKRPGLVSGLNPSPKVMKMYYNNKEKDKS